MSSYTEHSNDLVLIIFLNVLLALILIFIPDNFIRILLGVPFVIFIPGYVLVSVLYPKREIDNLERFALSFGLSFAVDIIIALALNFTPWGITTTSIFSTAFAFNITCCLIAIHLRGKAKEERFSLSFKLPKKEVSREDKMLALMIAVVLLIGILILLYVITYERTEERYTELYVLNEGGKVDDYPKSLREKENGTVIVGIVNHEYKTTEYVLIIKLSDKIEEKNLSDLDVLYVNDLSKTFTLSSNYSIGLNITLRHDEKWEKSFTFNIDEQGIYKLEFVLYRKGEEKPHIWPSPHIEISVKSKEL